MTAPEKLPADLEALLACERAAPGMPEAARSRVLARLGASLPPPPDGGPGGGDGGPGAGEGGPGAVDGSAADGAAAIQGSSAAGSGASGVLGAIAHKPALLATTMFALGGAGGALVYHSASGPAPAPPRHVSAPPTADAGPAKPPAVAILIDAGFADAGREASVPEIAEPAPAPPSQPAAPPPRSDEELAAERALMEVARTALARGEAGDALKRLRRHAREFPRGQLREEREALWIRALVIDRDFAGAALRAERFQERYPRSLFLPMIRDALAKSRNLR